MRPDHKKKDRKEMLGMEAVQGVGSEIEDSLLEKEEKVDAEILVETDIKKMSKCTRCGKERIVKTSSTELMERSVVTYTTTICPDPECQKLVEKGLVVEENKRRVIREEQETRARELASKKRDFRHHLV